MAQELSTLYTLAAPHFVPNSDGTPNWDTGPQAVFGPGYNQAAPEWVGYLTSISGLDSPEVRENAENIVEGDGAIHGPFRYGRRIITMEGMLLPDVATLNDKTNRLQLVTNLTLVDGRLQWVESGTYGGEKFIHVRRSQPLRLQVEQRPRRFFLSLAAANPRILSNERTPTAVPFSTSIAGNNQGTTRCPVIVRINGPQNASSFVLEVLSGSVISQMTINTTVASGHHLLIDMTKRTVVDVTTSSGVRANRYGAVDISSKWWEVPPNALIGGANSSISLYNTSGAGTWTVTQWDAWI